MNTYIFIDDNNGIYWYDATGFLVVYTVYVIVVVVANKYYEKQNPPIYDDVGRKKGKKSYYLKVSVLVCDSHIAIFIRKFGILLNVCYRNLLNFTGNKFCKGAFRT